MGRRKIGSVHGVLLLDKPAGVTSNHALQRVRRHLGAGRGGHTGALDPLATGVLPLCFGEATKFSQWSLDADKAYEVTAKLGVSTDTADADGEPVDRLPVPALSESGLRDLLSREFTGPMVQTPPRYSALKHEGKPLYQLAREGKPIPDKSRTVTLHESQLVAMGADWLTLRVRVSKGTYIRSVVEDLAIRLGTLGHVTALRRLSHGAFRLAQAVTLDTVMNRPSEATRAELLPADACVSGLPTLALNDEQWAAVRHGHGFTTDESAAGPVRLYFQGKFCGLAEAGPGNQVKCLRLVNPDLLLC